MSPGTARAPSHAVAFQATIVILPGVPARPRLPLSDLRVVDLSRVLAGPYAAQILGDLGADVIKVEHPRGDDTRRWGAAGPGADAYYWTANRN